MDELEKDLRGMLPKNAHKYVAGIVEYITTMPIYLTVNTVEVHHARVPVETVLAYGLELRLDALGDAVTVTFPRGAEVIK